MISRLRQRATRHRKLADALTSSQDRLIALAEAGQTETEASRLEAELSGAVTGVLITAPLYEQI
jgi:hypothetical protein